MRYTITLLLCIFLMSCYSKEARLKKQIKTWEERTKDIVPDSNSFTRKTKDSTSQVRSDSVK